MKYKQQVVDALRSGEFVRLNGFLGKPGTNERCCLGVFCEVAIRNGLDLPVTEGESAIAYKTDIQELPVLVFDTDIYDLPASVSEFFGLYSYDPEIPGSAVVDGNTLCEIMNHGLDAHSFALSYLNDSGKFTFRQLADLIEEYL